MTFPRYSHAETNDQGYIGFDGDLYNAARTRDDLRDAIAAHLAEAFPEHAFKVTVDVVGLRRAVSISILKSPVDLTDATHLLNTKTTLSDEIMRFGFDHSCPQTDLTQKAFRLEISVSPSYWARWHASTGYCVIKPTMSLSAFKRALKAGDTLEVLEGPRHGKTYTVKSVGRRIVTDNGEDPKTSFHWDFPASDCFFCDENTIYIVRGTDADPHSRQIMRWTQRSAR